MVPNSANFDGCDGTILVVTGGPTKLIHPTDMTSDQCAVGPDGKLLDAAQMQWFHSPSDDVPASRVSPAQISPSPAPKTLPPAQPAPTATATRRTSTRNAHGQQEKLRNALAKLNTNDNDSDFELEEGSDPEITTQREAPKKASTAAPKKSATTKVTAPKVASQKAAKRQRSPPVTVEEIEDEDAPKRPVASGPSKPTLKSMFEAAATPTQVPKEAVPKESVVHREPTAKVSRVNFACAGYADHRTRSDRAKTRRPNRRPSRDPRRRRVEAITAWAEKRNHQRR